MIAGFNEKDWPYEVQIDTADGLREYSQYGKDNGDGTASFISWGENGPFVKIVPIEIITFRERPWELEEKWHARFREIFGLDLRK